ncbi:DJ-1/PfpI family protein [Nonomuraea zeae]|uniref:DJ-1/PfpI family protein n=1 Tax=Nonomuraea zeae TaxID=1642303 RepID=A0A5S4GPR7_9ACTN|nr:DJ-1/PfpI family protein [Nonomuraea zeae]TMR34494.1 DJ-1/PfpI family protein [Nonomuraea zeae]
MHAQIVLFDGFDPLDAVAPFEVLSAGGTASPGAVTVELVSAEGPREVVSGTGGLALRATAALDPGRAGLVLVPGAAGRIGEPGETPDHDAGDEPGQPDDSIPVLLGRTLATELPVLLKAAMDNPEVTVSAVCGGSLVLAMAGLLEGRHATTHHLGLDLLDATGVHAVPARVVDDGDLVTGAGVTSGLDLSLYLLEREVGPRIAHAVEELFAYERRGTVWRNVGPEPARF